MFIEHPENQLLKLLRDDNLMGCPPNFKEDADVRDSDDEVAANAASIVKAEEEEPKPETKKPPKSKFRRRTLPTEPKKDPKKSPRTSSTT